MDTGYQEITITEQDLEWMRFQQELRKQICAIFDIPVEVLGICGQIVDGTLQPVPLALPPAIEE